MWLITGSEGQLGTCLVSILRNLKIECHGVARQQLNITDAHQIRTLFKDLRPQVVVNAAAWTKVDDAEDHEDSAFAVNCTGARHVAEGAHHIGARLVHISTDYVFDGKASSPIPEQTPGNPLGAYGRTKWAGEQAIREVLPEDSLIVRTAWLYSEYGANFAKTMARRAVEQQPARVVNDQFGQPTLASDLAIHIVNLVENHAPAGTYHGTNSGETTWFGFAQMIYKLIGADPNLVSPVPSTEYPTRAVRPNYSVLGHTKTLDAGLKEMRHWEEAVRSSMSVIVSTIDQN